jgi:shikimate kinase
MTSQSIILIGMPASGKSTIGRRLAAALGYQFTDLDVYISEKEGRTLQEIIDSQGEDVLMQIEKERMLEINLNQRVVAPGGSLVYHTDLMPKLKQQAVIVYLNESLGALEKRLGNASTRGIIGFKGKSLAEIYAERAPLYARYADIVINCENLTREQITREILQQLSARP